MQQQLELAPDTLQDARAWKEANPTAYALIIEWAKEDVSEGMKPAIDLYVNLLRRPHFARKLGLVRTDDVYTVNNTLRSQLARLLVEETGLPFELRHSKHELGTPNGRPEVGR